jgi:hypothetical protein
MHPYMIELLARQRESELRRSACDHGRHVPRRRRGSVRHRAGWALVAIGLTLAHGSGDAASEDRRPGHSRRTRQTRTSSGPRALARAARSGKAPGT